MIPAQAVEAAAKAYYELGFGSWEGARGDTRAVHMEDMRAALEAAAPHLMAAAWEQGWEAREDLHAYDVWGGEGEEPNSSNPYKKVTK